MGKSAFYFSHDANARNDEKVIALRLKYGAEGYGIYFMILERLMESKEYIHVKDYNIIAFDLRVSNSIVKSIIEDYGLFEFTDDGKHFYSVSFQKRMIPLENLRQQRRDAGIKSAEKRALKNDRTYEKDDENNLSSTIVERPLNKTSTTDRQKTNKVKESKVNTFTKVKGGASPPAEKKLEIDADVKSSFTEQKKKEKEKEKSSGKKEKEKPPEDIFWKVTVKAWFDYYSKKFNDTPTFNGLDGKCLKLLMQYLRRDTEAKGNQWTQDHALLCLNKFLDITYEIDWYKSHFQLKDIVSNYDSIKQSQQKQFKNAASFTDYSVRF